MNTLIRLYMQRFTNFFVEEVAVHQLASQAPLMGIYVHIESEGEVIDRHGVVERFPPIMRRLWLNHPQDRIDAFKQDLQKGVLPDSIALFGVRPRHFFNEASVSDHRSLRALDLSISRKIRAGYRKKGKTNTEIEGLLRQTSNQRFDERAKALLKDAVGKSAAEFTTHLGQTSSSTEPRCSQGVSHSHAEPPKKEAEQAIEDFLRMSGLVDGIVV